MEERTRNRESIMLAVILIMLFIIGGGATIGFIYHDNKINVVQEQAYLLGVNIGTDAFIELNSSLNSKGYDHEEHWDDVENIYYQEIIMGYYSEYNTTPSFEELMLSEKELTQIE